MSTENAIEIDENKVRRLILKIIIAEGKNMKSNEKTDMQMVQEIMNMIKEEVKCY